MRCPFCDHVGSRVVDSREAAGGEKIRRRRECADCERRYTTYERIEEPFPRVVKSEGGREDYDRQKIRRGVELACTKRSISTDAIEAVIDNVERRLLDLNCKEVSSDWIGSAVTEELRDLDPVAYIRFASVYRAFSEIQEFLEEVRELGGDETTSPSASDRSQD